MITVDDCSFDFEIFLVYMTAFKLILVYFYVGFKSLLVYVLPAFCFQSTAFHTFCCVLCRGCSSNNVLRWKCSFLKVTKHLFLLGIFVRLVWNCLAICVKFCYAAVLDECWTKSEDDVST